MSTQVYTGKRGYVNYYCNPQQERDSMSDQPTITIPANLFYGWTPGGLRHAAESNIGVRILLRRLADEIERQAPRAEGWYRIRHGDTGGPGSEWRLLYWNGSEWLFREQASMRRVIHEEDAEIEPVTIGRADS